MQKPSIPKGTRDFNPTEMMRRKFIFSQIESVFKKYGFKPIETPAMENISTLTGKYGDEGDQLLFKILNSRIHESKSKDLSKRDFDTLLERNINSEYLTERALRYDLTVPFARYVVMHQNEISFPFRRYQIQPVWRADKPQKGRYREFYQCDADIVGSDSLSNELDLIQIFGDVFQNLGIQNFELRINNRKILEGLAESIGAADKFKSITIAIDKLDKIGWEGVSNELQNAGLSAEQCEKARGFFNLAPLNMKTINDFSHLLAQSEIGMKGIAELSFIAQAIETLNLNFPILFDGSLARGLDYYTGCIFEVKPTGIKLGSISGGGRYDNLTGIFGLKGVSGVGISFGADRIYDLMEELNLFPDNTKEFTRLLLCPMNDAALMEGLKLSQFFRANNISTELYPSTAKLKKQLDYANSNHIPFVIIIGEDEIKSAQFSLKNMISGEQHSLNKEEILEKVQA